MLQNQTHNLLSVQTNLPNQHSILQPKQHQNHVWTQNLLILLHALYLLETCRRTHACEKGKLVAGDLHAEKVGASGSGREEEKKKEKKEGRRREKEKTGGNGDPERQLRPLAKKNFRPFIQDAYEKL